MTKEGLPIPNCSIPSYEIEPGDPPLPREIVDEIPCAIADLATGARRHTPTRFA
jgi:hypothetical protein